MLFCGNPDKFFTTEARRKGVFSPCLPCLRGEKNNLRRAIREKQLGDNLVQLQSINSKQFEITMRDFLLILHFIGLAMGLGTSFGYMFLGMAGAKLEKTEALKFRVNTLALSRMGQIGLALLVVSGLFLMGPFWGMLSEMYLLIAKLVLVLVLTGLIGVSSSLSRKITSAADAEPILNRMAPLGKMSLLTALAIVILAVLVFH